MDGPMDRFAPEILRSGLPGAGVSGGPYHLVLVESGPGGDDVGKQFHLLSLFGVCYSCHSSKCYHISSGFLSYGEGILVHE